MVFYDRSCNTVLLNVWYFTTRHVVLYCRIWYIITGHVVQYHKMYGILLHGVYYSITVCRLMTYYHRIHGVESQDDLHSAKVLRWTSQNTRQTSQVPQKHKVLVSQTVSSILPQVNFTSVSLTFNMLFCYRSKSRKMTSTPSNTVSQWRECVQCRLQEMFPSRQLIS